MEDGRGARTAPFTRLVAAVCMVVLALALTGCTIGTPTRAELEEEEEVSASLSSPTIAEDGVLTVAVDTSDAPQAMTDSSGEVTGFDVDVALAIADRLGLSVRIVDAADASTGIDELGADIFIGLDSDDDADGLETTDVYLQDATALFGNTTLSSTDVSLEDLESATIAVQDGSASQDALSRAGIVAVQSTYSNVNECFEALAAGEVDYVACDATSGAYLARMYADISFVGTISSTSSFTIAMSEGNEELVEAITDALDDIEADGTLGALHTAWYGDLPETLTGEQIDGVTVEDEEGEEESSEEVSESDAELMASDDINSLSE